MSEFMFIPECSWCGGNLGDIMKEENVTFDAALEAHINECEEAIKEFNGFEGPL